MILYQPYFCVKNKLVATIFEETFQSVLPLLLYRNFTSVGLAQAHPSECILYEPLMLSNIICLPAVCHCTQTIQ